MVQPIGQTVFGGLGFGTLMTLFLMPVLYYIFNKGSDKRAQRKLEKEFAELSERQEEKKACLATDHHSRVDFEFPLGSSPYSRLD